MRRHHVVSLACLTVAPVVTLVSFVESRVDAAVDIPDDAVDGGDLIGQFGRVPDEVQ